MTPEEILDRSERSENPIDRQRAARARELLAAMEKRLVAADKMAQIARLRAELDAARGIVRRPPRPLTTTVQAEIVRLYVEERLTMHAVGARVDRSYSTVRRALVDAGVPLRPRRWSA